MRVCWAEQSEEAPRRDFSRSRLPSFPVLGFFLCLVVCFGSMVPGLYEVVQYTHSVSSSRSLFLPQPVNTRNSI